MAVGVTPLNPLVYIVSVGAVLVLTLVAAWLPAMRATRVDPDGGAARGLELLRGEIHGRDDVFPAKGQLAFVSARRGQRID